MLESRAKSNRPKTPRARKKSMPELLGKHGGVRYAAGLMALSLTMLLCLSGESRAGSPTAVSGIIATTERVISYGDGGEVCPFPSCQVTAPRRYSVEGRVQAASDLSAPPMETRTFR
jgi:hypothetical protein